MVATPAKVIAIIQEPESMNSREQRIFTYLTQLIGDMKPQELATFLRFVSGSSICLGKKIEITFNNLSGLARRPIAHTCDCFLSHTSATSNFQLSFNQIQSLCGA